MTPDILLPPLTPTPASPLTLRPNWRTHYVHLLTSFGASGFWSTSQQCIICSQAWNDIQEIWRQKNQQELVYKMVSLIPMFRAHILNKRWFFFLLTRQGPGKRGCWGCSTPGKNLEDFMNPKKAWNSGEKAVIPGGPKITEQSIFYHFALINSYLFLPCWMEHLFLIIIPRTSNSVENFLFYE